MQLKAHAKINLGLDITGRRPNGYHDVSMIMQSLTVHDVITLEAVRRTGEEEPPVAITTNLRYIPTDRSNLVWKAAEALMTKAGVTDRVAIDLKKRIPVAAGLGGGSADAAVVLKGVNRLFNLGYDEASLREIGAGIGADVPFCLMEGTAHAGGIGEILTPLAPIKNCGILLAKPPFSISTKKVYEDYDSLEAVDHPDIEALKEALVSGDLTALGSRLGNVLETVTETAHPVIGELKAAMMRLGALGALMSGSGPTVFGLFKTRQEAAEAGRALKADYRRVRFIATSPLRTGGTT